MVLGASTLFTKQQRIIYTKVFNIDSHKYSLINYPFTKSNPFVILNLRKTTESNSLLNITIKNYTNNYDDNTLCRYGGIIFYDIIRGRNFEAQSVCENYREFYKQRNIYSQWFRNVTCHVLL